MTEEPLHPTLRPIFDELHGDRVTVRPYRSMDAQALFDAIIETRESLLPWMNFATQYHTFDDAREYINRVQARWLLREDFPVGFFETATGAYLGGSGLGPRDWQVPSFEIGYWIRTSSQGKGYVTEVVRLLSAYAFESLGAERVMIRCDARNQRSAAVALRAGFTFEGKLRKFAVATDGSIEDRLFFSRTRADRQQDADGEQPVV